MWTLWIGYVFGLGQGVRHALEPDHLAAVSTVVATQRSARSSAFFAMCWGAGHCLVLLVVGGALFLARREVPAPLGLVFELCVAAMLVALGLRALWQACSARGARGLPWSSRGDAASAGTSATSPMSAPSRLSALRPLAIGVVHGLAGSGALTVVVASNYRSALAGLLFIAVYGLGATAGMALLAGAVGLPLARAMRTRAGPPLLLGTTGLFSLVLGLLWGWPALQAVALQ
jgi:high-affinity nickel-transport protein